MGQQKLMEGTVIEETVSEGPFVERFTNETMVAEGTVNQKLKVDQLIVKWSGLEDLW